MTNLLDEINYKEVQQPSNLKSIMPIDLTDETLQEHKLKVLDRLKSSEADILIIYADREHGANFGYLTGFEPRFEEAALVLNKEGNSFLLLGNESLRMNQYSRIKSETVHVPHFSLPNQPMENNRSFEDIVKTAGIHKGMKVALAGWKMFTSSYDDNDSLLEVPYFIVSAIKNIVGENGKVINGTSLFINSEYGARVINNSNEIAHYEFGASLASSKVKTLLDTIEVGKTEMELADLLSAYGQPNNVTTICATGDRFTNAVVSPRYKEVKIGDKFTTTLGFRGGLTNRTGYVVSKENELPTDERDYLDKVAKPYFGAIATWYENVKIGMTGSEVYDLIDSVLPKSEFGWKLNPGHFTSSDEWMSSPIHKDSKTIIRSGMLFQVDIIPSVPGYHGVNAEDGVAIADKNLQEEIATTYPELWDRIQARREYMINHLGINISPDLLPLSTINGYMRPFLLDKNKALTKK
ncbi:M24 family metallopeptidase [Alkalicoccobacillus murimartini]|uniref:Xaa-Pro aminopeptidase n=1 Tax=Alkalicoccobacillus murimartini TaxID=171685 RepID=A0ABT9YL41_9BACI|nr:M24 family metallopeptidase [Alkalicoccobacillus murimartini]MDQ0208577.1 Xaa-Pro aminopeptidase [Alkalicoccobacillus murimartini]